MEALFLMCDTEWYEAEYHKKIRLQEQLRYRTIRGEILEVGDTIIFRHSCFSICDEFRVEDIRAFTVVVSIPLDQTGMELARFSFGEELFNDMDPRKVT